MLFERFRVQNRGHLFAHIKTQFKIISKLEKGDNLQDNYENHIINWPFIHQQIDWTAPLQTECYVLYPL